MLNRRAISLSKRSFFTSARIHQWNDNGFYGGYKQEQSTFSKSESVQPSASKAANSISNVIYDAPCHPGPNKMGTSGFESSIADILSSPINPEEFQIRPDGVLYLPEHRYRMILNNAFGVGGWAFVATGPLVKSEGVGMREYALYCHGKFVSQALGERSVMNGNSTVAGYCEGIRSNALMRCCKDLGIALVWRRMVLALVIGDLHIPEKKPDLPEKFKKLLVPGKIEHILFTGNLNHTPTWEYLKSISPSIFRVRGHWDDVDVNAAEEFLSVEIENCPLSIGLIHGHQLIPFSGPDAITLHQRRLGNVDVLITGREPTFKAFEVEGKLFISPGSGSGALGGVPSFVLMDIPTTGRESASLVVYIYQLIEDEVKVDKMEFKIGK